MSEFEKRNSAIFEKAFLDGYTVKKEQLYYLCEKNTGYYLNKKGKYSHWLVFMKY